MAIEGIITAMVTPLEAGGAIDESATVRLIHHLLENGSDGIVVAGTTGEGSTLDDDEKCALFGLAVAEAPDALVIANTGSNDTAHSVRLTERATALGVDAVFAVAPYYNKPNRRGLIEHYRAIAGATDRDVVLYNIPSRSVVDMPNDLLAELAEIPNVSAVKQARGEDIATIPGLDLLAGDDLLFRQVLDAGGTGGILVASHLVGTRMRQMIDEPESRATIDESLQDLYAALAVSTNPIPIKAALNLVGIEVGGLRLPMVDASDDELETIGAALDRLGLRSAV
ncbi:MAG: 4-hydroxy-tetrahydrodipicolinate synthase [Thermoleophilaceae bacterium]|nr:4-hydroxy-tetrahydrodipicolinate synthase [Thermoleophilaceae bacterium]